MKIKKTYSELIKLKTFEERFEYLKLDGQVGKATFGFQRWINQDLYHSVAWKKFRDKVIVRDNGCDLGVEGYEIYGSILVHHIEPITYEDIIKQNPAVFDLDNVISTQFKTHNAIHYGDKDLLITSPISRTPNDTCPWK